MQHGCPWSFAVDVSAMMIAEKQQTAGFLRILSVTVFMANETEG